MQNSDPALTLDPAVPLDELLAHRQWLSALARRLVTDAAEADDLVQETWLAALRRPPRDRRNLRGWLGRVATNAARARRRRRASGEVATGDAEVLQASAAPGGAADPADLAGEVELARDLVGAVLELDEPYRTSLLLRYWEGLDAAAIARREGVSASTVRWRQKVAHDALRERLDARHGDRRAWATALVPLAARSQVAARATAGSGLAAGIVGATLRATAIGATAAALVAVGAVALGLLGLLGSGEGSPSSATVAVVPDPAVLPRLGAGAAPVEPAVEGSARRRVSESSTAPEGDASASAAATTIVVRAVTPEGLPLPDARAEIFGSGQVFAADAEGRIELVHARHAVSGPDGWRVSDEAVGQVAVLVHAPGRELAVEVGTVRAGGTHLFGTLELGPGGTVRGRVVDGFGRPLWTHSASAAVARRLRVGAVPPTTSEAGVATELARDPYRFVEPDAEGRFVLHGVPSAPRRIAARVDGRVGGLGEVLRLAPGEERSGVELVLTPDPDLRQLTGRVLGPDGEPLGLGPYPRRARIDYAGERLFFSHSGGTHVDTEGRFAIATDRVGMSLSYTLTVAPPPGSGLAAVRRAGLGADARGVEFRLRPAERGWLTVRSSSGRLLGDARVSVPSMPRATAVEALGPESGPEGATHTYLAPDFGYRLVVEAPGHERVELGPFAAGAPRESIEVTLRQSPGIHGRVVDADGRPVPRARVQALTAHSGSARVDGFPARVVEWVEDDPDDPWLDLEDGRFRLDERDARRLYVRVEVEGFAPLERGPFDFDPERGLDLGRLVLGPGGALEGRALGRDGQPLVGAVVGINRGDGDPETQRTDAAGRFRFERLIPGGWQVRLVEEELPPHAHGATASFLPVGRGLGADCTVVEGETTWFDLTPGDAAPREVEVRVAVDDAAASGWTAALWDVAVPVESDASAALALTLLPSDAREDWTVTDADGRARLARLGSGPALLTVTSPGGRVHARAVELGEAPSVVELAVTTGPVELIGVDRVAGDTLGGLLVWRDGPWFGARRVEPARGARTTSVELPHGRVELLRFDAAADPTLRPGVDGGGPAAGLEVLARFEHRPGAPTRVELGR